MMKQYYKHLSAVIMIIVFTCSGCIEDKCAGIVCNNEGVCVDGTCACLQGYEGELCNGKWYEKFEGDWAAAEKDKKGNILNSYDISVIPSESPDTFYLLNLGGFVDTVKCARTAYRNFTMFERVLVDSTVMQSGDAQIAEDFKGVSGVYTFAKDDSTATVVFSWSK